MRASRLLRRSASFVFSSHPSEAHRDLDGSAKKLPTGQPKAAHWSAKSSPADPPRSKAVTPILKILEMSPSHVEVPKRKSRFKAF